MRVGNSFQCYHATSLPFITAWNYIRGTAEGPAGWNTNHDFPECSGASNSPINIVAADAEEVPAVKWTLTGYNTAHTWNVYDKHRTGEYNHKSQYLLIEHNSSI